MLAFKQSFGSAVYSAYELVVRELDGSDYDYGELETMQKSIKLIVEFQAKLVERLIDKGLLSAKDIVDFFPSYSEA
jgi:hypothetical protein